MKNTFTFIPHAQVPSILCCLADNDQDRNRSLTKLLTECLFLDSRINEEPCPTEKDGQGTVFPLWPHLICSALNQKLMLVWTQWPARQQKNQSHGRSSRGLGDPNKARTEISFPLHTGMSLVVISVPPHSLQAPTHLKTPQYIKVTLEQLRSKFIVQTLRLIL